MRILISGAGIAGPTLAYWLDRYGMTPTIAEHSPALRTGGYMIDFWGAGFTVADRMGLRPEILRHGYTVQEIRVVNRHGVRVAGFPAEVFARATRSGFTSLPRGDLAAAVFGTIADRVETIFGDSIAHLEQTPTDVRVNFVRHPPLTFDMVVGADGLHSRVRDLVFGPEARFERYLGEKVAAFQVEGYRPRDELVYVMYSEVGQQVARFAMRGDRTMFLFTFADDDPSGPSDLDGQRALLRRHFGRSGWECPQILDALDTTTDVYFDRVSQIRMPPSNGLWTRGRVTLVGDAASCVSLLAGQGTALAMTGAYILAGELHRTGGNAAEACDRYQRLFGPFVAKKQRAAQRFAGVFAPKSKLSLFARNQIMRLLTTDWVANLTAGRGFKDPIVLPEY